MAATRTIRQRLSSLFARSKSDAESGTTNPLLWFSRALSGWTGSTVAGLSVNPTTAMRCAAVFACIRVVSEDVAKLPLVIYRRSESGMKEPATDHPLYALFRARPNRWQSTFEWLEMMQAHLELRGNAYSYIVRDRGGRIVELLPLHPDRVQLLLSTDGDVFYDLSPAFNEPSVPSRVPREAVLHLRGMTLDGYHGLTPISYARETIGLSLAAEQHGAAYFGNGARPDLVLSAEGPLSADAAAEIRKSWEENYRGANRAHRPAVVPFGMKVTQLGVTNKDSQFLELRQFQVSDVARVFRIPPHKIGDLSRATFTNIEHQSLEYYLDGLMPRLERFEAAMTRDLLTDAELAKYEIEFDFTRILRGDLNTTMTAIGTARNWGIINANEGRRWLNMPPRPDKAGEDYLEPLNMVSAGELPQPAVEPPQQVPAPPPSDQAARNIRTGLN